MSEGSEGQQRLLVIPFAPGIGDVVMMEPLLRAIVTSLPDWKVTLVARGYAADVLQPGRYELACPFYFVNQAPPALRPLHRLIPQSLIAWAAEPAMALDLGPFDRTVNLFWAWEHGTPFEQWWTPRWPPVAGVRHTVDLLADYLEGELGMAIPPTDRVPRLAPFPEGRAWAQRYLRAQVLAGRPLASLVVSSENALKWWSVPRWAELNESLVQQGWQTLLVSTRGNEHAEQISRACRTTPLWPEVGLREMAGLLAASQVVVGIDTGPLHMAAALGTPWVGLFGPTNPDLIGPYDRRRGMALLARFPKPDSCRACWRSFKNRVTPCPTLPAAGCATLITVEEVMAAIDVVQSGTRIA